MARTVDGLARVCMPPSVYGSAACGRRTWFTEVDDADDVDDTADLIWPRGVGSGESLPAEKKSLAMNMLHGEVHMNTFLVRILSIGTILNAVI